MSFFDVRAKMPKTRFTGENMVKLIEAAIKQSVGDEGLRLYEATTRTWTHKPGFKREETPRGVRILVGKVRRAGKSIDIWRYLDEGTSVRYATMTSDYRAKTRPGYLVSYTGAGRLAYVSKKVPRAGIEPRNWSDKINARMISLIRKEVKEAIRFGLLNHA